MVRLFQFHFFIVIEECLLLVAYIGTELQNSVLSLPADLKKLQRKITVFIWPVV